MLCDRDPVDTWTQGRVALLGDAAHPMLPYTAQGACMALEDAVVIGPLLDCGADAMPQRLEKYGALRRERTARVQLVARELARRLHHLEGAAARTRRNGMLSAMSVDDLHGEVAWLHGPRDFADGSQQSA
ncbi:FAD-dependent monooxygenase [Streptomyces sp. M10(2022)]